MIGTSILLSFAGSPEGLSLWISKYAGPSGNPVKSTLPSNATGSDVAHSPVATALVSKIMVLLASKIWICTLPSKKYPPLRDPVYDTTPWTLLFGAIERLTRSSLLPNISLFSIAGLYEAVGVLCKKKTMIAITIKITTATKVFPVFVIKILKFHLYWVLCSVIVAKIKEFFFHKSEHAGDDI